MRAHLEAMVLQTKPEANKWLHLFPQIQALGMDAFESGPPMIGKIHVYLVRELNFGGQRSREVSGVHRQKMPDDTGQKTCEEKKVLRGRISC